jgi:hypothetical protein
MKIKPVLYLFILLLPLTSYGQGRHLKGIRGIELIGGITGQGVYGMLGASQNLSAVTYGKIAVAYEPGSIDDVKYHSYMIDASINYTLIQIKDDVFFNAFLGDQEFMMIWKSWKAPLTNRDSPQAFLEALRSRYILVMRWFFNKWNSTLLFWK